jgi:hypothetical protein
VQATIRAGGSASPPIPVVRTASDRDQSQEAKMAITSVNDKSLRFIRPGASGLRQLCAAFVDSGLTWPCSVRNFVRQRNKAV